jgi:hypothetical protein
VRSITMPRTSLETYVPPSTRRGTLKRATISGSIASLAVTGALALLAQREGKRPLQPINATSHWLHGKRAGRVKRSDLAHTALGYVTNHAASVFWATLLEAWLGRRRRTPLSLLRKASAVTALAAAVDYGLMPKRLTPGWELAVSKRAVATSFVVMAFGLAVGAMLARRSR